MGAVAGHARARDIEHAVIHRQRHRDIAVDIRNADARDCQRHILGRSLRARNRAHGRIVHRRDVQRGRRGRTERAIRRRVGEGHAGVVVCGRRIAPGRGIDLGQRAETGLERQRRDGRRRSVDVGHTRQKFGRRDHTDAAVFGNRRQRHRRRHRRIVDRRNVQRGGRGGRQRTVRRRIGEGHAGVVIGGRRVAPGRGIDLGQRAEARLDRKRRNGRGRARRRRSRQPEAGPP